MAAIPEANEGMQLSQRFSGVASELHANMDALKLSLETLNFGEFTVQSSPQLVQLCALQSAGRLDHDAAVCNVLHCTCQASHQLGHKIWF